MTYLQDSQHAPTVRVNQALVGDYIALLKPRVMSLVLFTAIVGLFLAPGHVNPAIAGIAILCIGLGAGASGALNMWYDSDIDAIMSRTRNRPIPAGRVEPGEALAIGLVLSGFSVVTLWLATNWMAAALLAFTIFFYAVIYTMWLKRATPQNIVIGGAAGAFPPMIGWAAVTGGVDIQSALLFLIIFLWTPPHFWALALYKQGDYAEAGIPMMPNVAGEASTRRQILAYSLILVLSTLVPPLVGLGGPVYAAVAALSGAVFMWLAFKLWRADERREMKRTARSLFAYSLSYLFVIFLGFVVDRSLALVGLL